MTAVQHFLGHQNASETLDAYSHLWPDNEGKIRAAIDAWLGDDSYTLRTKGVSSA